MPVLLMAGKCKAKSLLSKMWHLVCDAKDTSARNTSFLGHVLGSTNFWALLVWIFFTRLIWLLVITTLICSKSCVSHGWEECFDCSWTSTYELSQGCVVTSLGQLLTAYVILLAYLHQGVSRGGKKRSWLYFSLLELRWHHWLLCSAFRARSWSGVNQDPPIRAVLLWCCLCKLRVHTFWTALRPVQKAVNCAHYIVLPVIPNDPARFRILQMQRAFQQVIILRLLENWRVSAT